AAEGTDAGDGLLVEGDVAPPREVFHAPAEVTGITVKNALLGIPPRRGVLVAVRVPFAIRALKPHLAAWKPAGVARPDRRLERLGERVVDGRGRIGDSRHCPGGFLSRARPRSRRHRSAPDRGRPPSRSAIAWKTAARAAPARDPPRAAAAHGGASGAGAGAARAWCPPPAAPSATLRPRARLGSTSAAQPASRTAFTFAFAFGSAK